jgi:hypothetical protein
VAGTLRQPQLRAEGAHTAGQLGQAGRGVAGAGVGDEASLQGGVSL